MKELNETTKGCGIIVLLFVSYLGWCYFEQWGHRRWAATEKAVMSKTDPGARLVSTPMGGDLINPVSWFWPAPFSLIYARPDSTVTEPRFMVITWNREDRDKDDNPSMILDAVDCKARTYITYFPEGPEDTGEPARTMLGDEFRTPDGKRFLRYDTKIDPAPDLVKAFCDTDWTREREIVRRR